MSLSKTAIVNSICLIKDQCYSIKKTINNLQDMDGDYSEMIEVRENELIDLENVINFLRSQHSI